MKKLFFHLNSSIWQKLAILLGSGLLLLFLLPTIASASTVPLSSSCFTLTYPGLPINFSCATGFSNSSNIKVLKVYNGFYPDVSSLRTDETGPYNPQSWSSFCGSYPVCQTYALNGAPSGDYWLLIQDPAGADYFLPINKSGTTLVYGSLGGYSPNPVGTFLVPADSSTNNYVNTTFTGDYTNATGYASVEIFLQDLTDTSAPLVVDVCDTVSGASGSYSCTHGLLANHQYQYDAVLWNGTSDITTSNGCDSISYNLMGGCLPVPFTFTVGTTLFDPSTATHFVSTDPDNAFNTQGDTHTSTTIDSIADTSSLYTNEVLHGEGITEGTVVSSKSTHSIVISQATTSSLTATNISFSDTVPLTKTLSATIYVNPADYVSGMYLDISITNFQVQAVGGDALQAWNSAFGGQGDNGTNTIQIPITHDGFSTLTHSITFSQAGSATMTYSVVTPSWLSGVPLIGSLFGGNTLVSKNVDFVISAQTVFDNLFKTAVVGNGLPLVAGILSGGITTSLPSCEIATFSFSKCAYSLIIPSSADLANVWTSFHDDFLTRFPLGYITRLTTILTTGSSVIPPPLTYTFGTSSPTVLQGDTVSFQIWNHLDILNGIKSDQGDNKNLWNIVDPFFQIVVSCAVLFVILGDIFKFDFGSFRGSDSDNRQMDFSAKEMEHINNPTVANTEAEYQLYKKL